jgi:ribosomal protein S27AE
MAGTTLRWIIDGGNKVAHKNNKMICSKCGDLMNHHTDKLIDSTERNVTSKIDPSLVV